MCVTLILYPFCGEEKGPQQELTENSRPDINFTEANWFANTFQYKRKCSSAKQKVSESSELCPPLVLHVQRLE